MTKCEELDAWLEANPDKTDRDWLLEVRCANDDEREQMKALFSRVDENEFGGDFEIAPLPVTMSVCDRAPGTPDFVSFPLEEGTNKRIVEPEFDFRFGGIYYDMDTPKEIYDNHPFRSICQKET